LILSYLAWGTEKRIGVTAEGRAGRGKPGGEKKKGAQGGGGGKSYCAPCISLLDLVGWGELNNNRGGSKIYI